jgi:hypothetical protein
MSGLVEKLESISKLNKRLESPPGYPGPAGFDEAIGRRTPSHNAFCQVSGQRIIAHGLLFPPVFDRAGGLCLTKTEEPSGAQKQGGFSITAYLRAAVGRGWPKSI